MPTWKRVVIPILFMLLSTCGFVWFLGLHDVYQDYYYNFLLSTTFPSTLNESHVLSNATSTIQPKEVDAISRPASPPVVSLGLLPAELLVQGKLKVVNPLMNIAQRIAQQQVSNGGQEEGTFGQAKEVFSGDMLHLIGAPAISRSPVDDLNFSVIPAEVRKKWKQWAEQWVPTTLVSTVWQTLPRVDLWVRTFTPGADKLITILYESLELFWPKHYGQLVILLDNESSADHAFGKLISQIPPFPRVFYQPEPDWSLFPSVICGRTKGYDRQMYSGFYADLYTDAPFIGLVDNDALFTSVVPPSAIFDDQLRPIVIAKTTRYDERGNPFVMGPMNGRWALATTKALGLPQAADFMWNFPVTVRRAAFAEVRDFIAKRFNTTFERAFFEIARTKGSYCQINIILNYEWYFHRAKYKWHLQSVAGASQLFINGTYNVPKARVATHARGSNSNDVYAYIRQGYCFGCITLDNCADKSGQKEAQHILKYYHQILFNWIKTQHLWVEKGQKSQSQAQAEHYTDVKKLNFTWSPNLKWILHHRVQYYTNCEVPPDDKNCVDYNERMHRKHAQKVAASLKPKHFWLADCVKTFRTIVPDAEANAR
eukprot:GGOE01001303.1.p1 GENE.GGOE01001303.1~~GGOE01001303.1.p1  ORF type:complete len:607 (-),score=66.09 GGOE01001303.1:24-1814(-)